MATLKDFKTLTEFFVTPPQNTMTGEKEIARSLQKGFTDITDWNKDTIFQKMKVVLIEYNSRMPRLYTLFTGKDKGLPLPESLEILGRDEVLKRLETSLT
jgi:glutamyl/glutaminyl-tRNA synthetase